MSAQLIPRNRDRVRHHSGGLRDLASEISLLIEKVQPRQLLLTLDQFERALSVHFGSEECPSGWFEEAQQLEPRVGSKVDELRSQHKEILEKIKILQKEIQEGMQRVEGNLQACLNLFERHEKEEERLIKEVFYQDLGGP